VSPWTLQMAHKGSLHIHKEVTCSSYGVPQHSLSTDFQWVYFQRKCYTLYIILFGREEVNMLEIWNHCWWVLCHYETYFKSRGISYNLTAPEDTKLDQQLASMTTTVMQVAVFWDVTWCSVVVGYLCFGVPCCLRAARSQPKRPQTESLLPWK
jgi:hypothetical protein